MNGIDDLMLYGDGVCPFCEGTGEPNERDEYEYFELGYCEHCHGTGKDPDYYEENTSIKEEKIVVFKCECGYIEYNDEEGLGYCPLCK